MIGEQIVYLIDKKINALNTVDIALVTEVHADQWTVDVRLKHTIDDAEIQIKNVPILHTRFGESMIVMLPLKGSVVLLAYTKYESARQLENDEVRTVNPLSKHQFSNAIVIGGLFTAAETIPHVVAEGEVLIHHKSGSYIWFKDSGAIEINSPVEVNVVVP